MDKVKDGKFGSIIHGNKKTVITVVNTSLESIPENAHVNLSMKVRWELQTKISNKKEEKKI